MRRKKIRNKLPKLWPYSYDDKTTWPFIECLVDNTYGDLTFVNWVPNPDFKYKNLMADSKDESHLY